MKRRVKVYSKHWRQHILKTWRLGNRSTKCKGCGEEESGKKAWEIRRTLNELGLSESPY
jgi:hypothetical protein